MLQFGNNNLKKKLYALKQPTDINDIDIEHKVV